MTLILFTLAAIAILWVGFLVCVLLVDVWQTRPRKPPRMVALRGPYAKEGKWRNT